MDRNLQTFLAVAATGNITAAAGQLHITQPTLTKRMQQLEASYGCKLIERLPRGVKLTRFGEQLLPYAERIEHEYLQALEAIRSVESGHLDELRIGAGPLFNLRYLGPAFDRLRAEFPKTAIRLTADVNSRNLPKLRDGSQDIMFGTTEYLDARDQIVFRQLTTVEQGLVLRADHPVVQKQNIQPRDLVNIPWIVYSDTPENEEMIRSYFSAQGFPPPQFIMQTTSFSLGFQMVAENDYAMALPVQLAPILDPARLRVIRLAPPIGTKPAGAYDRRSSRDYPVISRLIEIVAEVADERSGF